MALRYLNKQNVKRYISDQGMRSTTGFLGYLDHRIEEIIDGEIRNAHPAKTLNCADSAAVQTLQKTIPRGRRRRI